MLGIVRAHWHEVSSKIVRCRKITPLYLSTFVLTRAELNGLFSSSSSYEICKSKSKFEFKFFVLDFLSSNSTSAKKAELFEFIK